jgi:hypothetical protein
MEMTPMVLPFNEQRATEAAARFLKLRGGRMSYLKLIKLLYLLDREALLRWGRPVTTDTYVAMDSGPMLWRIYRLILEEPCPAAVPVWRSCISAPREWDVQLLAEPFGEELSPAELALIDEMFLRFGMMNRWDLVKISCQLPEWHDPDGVTIPIDYSDILRAAHKTDEEIADIESGLVEWAMSEVTRRGAGYVSTTATGAATN